MPNELDRRSFLNRTVAGTLLGGAFAKAWAAPASSDSSSPVVETTAGKIRGTIEAKAAPFVASPMARPPRARRASCRRKNRSHGQGLRTASNSAIVLRKLRPA